MRGGARQHAASRRQRATVGAVTAVGGTARLALRLLHFGSDQHENKLIQQRVTCTAAAAGTVFTPWSSEGAEPK
jgi:hypothetical protein